MNTQPPNVPYTLWHLIEHLRITQWDILDYMRNPNYQEIKWPDDYWPAKDAQADQTTWDKTIRQFHDDLEAIKSIVKDPKTDLFTYSPQFRMATTGIRFCARCCWSPTTMPTTSGNSAS
jgi:hypothetical protein